MNIQFLIGHLGDDPKLNQYGDGENNYVANFSVATTSSWYNKDTKTREKITQWHKCVMWGKNAKSFCKFHSKGDRVCVQGETQHSSYVDKDNNTRYKTEVIVTNPSFPYEFVKDSNRSNNNSNDSYQPQQQQQQPQQTTAFNNSNDDDLPF